MSILKMKKSHKNLLLIVGTIVVMIALYVLIVNNKKQQSPIIEVGPDGLANMDATSDPIISTQWADLK